MIKSICLKIVFLTLFTFCIFEGAQKVNAFEWNILEIKLGDTIDQSIISLKNNVSGIIIEPVKKGILRMGNFSSHEIIYGLSAHTPLTNNINEMINIACDPMSQGSVIGIERKISYGQDDAKPTINSVVNSLIDKYGKPDIIKHEYNSNLKYYWFQNASGKYAAAIKNNNLPNSIEGGFGNSTASIYLMSSGINGNLVNSIDTEAGISLCCQIYVDPKSTNKTLVDGITIQLDDHLTAKNSLIRLNKIMVEGSNAANTKQTEQAEKNKPKF